MIDLGPVNDALRLAGPHRTRPIRFVRHERSGDWRLKLYTIAARAADGTAVVRPALFDEALRRIPEIYPTGAGEHYPVGFVTVHDAASAAIVLYYWWQSFNELHQRIYVGPRENPAAMVQLPNQAAGCVWELEIVNFERRAWLDDVLANPDGPNVERYAARTLADIEI